jgi:hypothetical protein
VDSIDLAYDKRISNLEATLSPLLQSYDSFHSRMTPAKISEQINLELQSKLHHLVDVHGSVKREMENLWTLHYESQVKQLIERDSSELKAMVRQDLKRLETLMMSSSYFEKEGRRSISEIPSLRQSLDSHQEDENAFAHQSVIVVVPQPPDTNQKNALKILSAANNELKAEFENLEAYILGTSETINEKIEEIMR